jgi:hypothetical protein
MALEHCSGHILTLPPCAQDRANLIYEQKMAAEKRGEVDLAAKLERDFKVGFFSKIHHFSQQTFFISLELKGTARADWISPRVESLDRP